MGNAADCVRLIDNGMDPNIRNDGTLGNGDDDNGDIHEFHCFQPLHFACSNGHFAAAQALLRAGASADAMSSHNGGHDDLPLTHGLYDESYWFTSK